ncbi:MAG: hypothetical protein ABEK10_02985 [Candidatus Nanosalina sp.]
MTGSGLWISRLIESDRFSTGSTFADSFLKLGWIPLFLYAAWFLTVGNSARVGFTAALLLHTLMLSQVPFLLHYWHRKIFPEFFEKVSELVEDISAAEKVKERMENFYTDRYYITTGVWCLGLVLVFLLASDLMQSQGVTGPGSIGYWIYLGLILYTGVFTGIGIHLIVTAIRTVRKVSEVEFKIYPLHPDGLGGLSSIGYFAIWTTLLASIGSFALPIAFQVAARAGLQFLVFSLVGVYIFLIAFSFFYPTVKVNRKAQERQEEMLHDYRDRIRKLQDKLDRQDLSDKEKQSIRLEIQEARDEYHEINNVSLYPLTISILTRLAGSVLLPLTFIFLEMYLPQII